MPRKGETARYKGTKAAPTKAVQKERDRKKARDKKDAPICEKLGCRGRLNTSRPECAICLEENGTHKLIPCGHVFCRPHADHCVATQCAVCMQNASHHQPVFNLATCSPAQRDFLGA
jgi:hypothetical protein